MPTPNDRGPHRPRTNIQYHVENGLGGARPAADAAGAGTPTQEQRRAAARRARAKRRRRRQLALIGTACGILVVSGVITALLPAKGADAPLTSDAPANTRLVAPVPYAGSNGQRRHGTGPELGHRRPAEAGRRRRIHLHGRCPLRPPPCRSSAGWTPAGLRTPRSSAIR